MRKFKTDKRLERIVKTIQSRQPSLKIVMENIHDPHNVSAIFRTCDAVGVPLVSLLYTYEEFPKIGKKSSASAFKWVGKEKFRSVDDCYSTLRNDGFKVIASSLTKGAKSLYELDLTKKMAIVLGNEKRGVSDDAASMADEIYYIPMMGMVQSLNVSVAAAVTLYEALRQRFVNGMYDTPGFSKEEIDKLIDDWCEK